LNTYRNEDREEYASPFPVTLAKKEKIKILEEVDIIQ